MTNPGWGVRALMVLYFFRSREGYDFFPCSFCNDRLEGTQKEDGGSSLVGVG